MVAPGRVLRFPTETIEVLATPAATGDRYRARLTAPPGGGPGIRGAGLHVHPGVDELFRVVAGTATMRLGRRTRDVSAGAEVEAPAGAVHGFVNSGDVDLVLDVDLVFTPPGPRPEADVMTIGLVLDGLIRDGKVGRRTGMPSVLQLAVLVAEHPEAMTQPGVAGMLMRPLAALGRLRGLRSAFPEYVDDPSGRPT